MKSSIAIVLVEPESVDNIGAVARAMKNMGLTDLRLVKPPSRWKAGGKKMAVNAYDLLEKAKCYTSLKEAISDQHVTVALTRRHGTRRRDYVAFDQSIQLAKKKSNKWKKAFVFGKESKGLSNEDIAMCDWMTTIPTSPQYGSINLAQSVMIVSFSLFFAEKTFTESYTEDGDVMVKNIIHTPFLRVNQKEKEDTLNRFRDALEALDYEAEGNTVIDRIYGTFQRLLNRAGLLRSEAKMIKGLSRRILRIAGQTPSNKSSSKANTIRKKRTSDLK